MKRLARRDSLYLLFFLLAAVVLITLPTQRKLALATAVRSTVLAPVLHLQSGLSDMRAMRSRTETLRAERDSLVADLLALQGVGEENLRLRALLSLAERGQNLFHPANLFPTGRAGEGVKRSFSLDVGSDDDVEVDAPVVAAGGLVGVVRVAGPRQATGDFWTHPEFRVSAMTADGQVFGIIRPISGNPSLMQLDGAPFQSELGPGTELVTSGLGGVFPRGVPIGRVVELMATEAGWSRSYLVQPWVLPDAVREVMVLVDRSGTDDLTRVWQPAVPDSQP